MPRVLQASQRRAAGITRKRRSKGRTLTGSALLVATHCFSRQKLDRQALTRTQESRLWATFLVQQIVYGASAPAFAGAARSLSNVRTCLTIRDLWPAFNSAGQRLARAYRCRTRSLISWVRPWFQNWVPMYPQVRRATLSFSWSRLPHFGHSHTSLPSSSTIWISPS